MSAESQLPRPADGSPAGIGAAPTGKAPSRLELQAEIEQSRAELGATIDALTTQLSPGYQARRATTAARTAAVDAGALLTGGGMPAGDERRARNVKVLLGSVAVLAAVVVLNVVAGRRARR
ncbi:hypothetical protein Xcel_3085 [Xylanimonas cellulosilytica DSM 15894]|uniref:DUF3618 domain-containing protein n=1 Tax=Xylanimonas cellulosilytica (strain DSM 15894 / JCM 12276 / CECT 5975 / KCTC 9989 / LMG 20990 / NBRC 107835 / XIL07) TaxID=446471 RepID=D1BZV9_XYLCX|nr:DUF3618 domain-containing protein [Xylanimonas cellulosilytica]ACZ32087.1 hypothetical protein Xcel_3085 [Xylanimonas cellulosilytica DSM 15894]